METSTPSKLGARDEMGRLEKVCRALSAHTIFDKQFTPLASEEV